VAAALRDVVARSCRFRHQVQFAARHSSCRADNQRSSARKFRTRTDGSRCAGRNPLAPRMGQGPRPRILERCAQVWRCSSGISTVRLSSARLRSPCASMLSISGCGRASAGQGLDPGFRVETRARRRADATLANPPQARSGAGEHARVDRRCGRRRLPPRLREGIRRDSNFRVGAT